MRFVKTANSPTGGMLFTTRAAQISRLTDASGLPTLFAYSATPFPHFRRGPSVAASACMPRSRGDSSPCELASTNCMRAVSSSISRIHAGICAKPARRAQFTARSLPVRWSSALGSNAREDEADEGLRPAHEAGVESGEVLPRREVTTRAVRLTTGPHEAGKGTGTRRCARGTGTDHPADPGSAEGAHRRLPDVKRSAMQRLANARLRAAIWPLHWPPMPPSARL